MHLNYRHFILAIAISCLLLASFVVWHALKWQHFLTTPIVMAKSVDVVFAPLDSVNKFLASLKNNGISIDERFFIKLIKQNPDNKNIKAGEYRLTPGMTPVSLLQNLVQGRGIMRSFTIVEGWNFQQIKKALSNNPYLKLTLDSLTDERIALKISDGAYNSLEGLLAADTYLFARGTPDGVILKKAYQSMQNILRVEWQLREPNLSYTSPYQALILASLVEKETAIAKERPLIAGVLLGRLQKNMRLQVDSTVIYALGKGYNGKITIKDLKKVSSYNTYINYQLPPTPIAIPSIFAINAALHPVLTQDLYYMADGNGGHVFSKTLKEHNRAVKRYRLRMANEK